MPVEGSYFIMADHRMLGFANDVELCRDLVVRGGVAAIPPSAFYERPEDGAAFVRFAFCKRQETLDAAIERLRALAGGADREAGMSGVTGGAGGAGVIPGIGAWISGVFRRYAPDPFVLALLLTLLTAAVGRSRSAIAETGMGDRRERSIATLQGVGRAGGAGDVVAAGVLDADVPGDGDGARAGGEPDRSRG
jgi:hypothetical protein